MIALGTIGGFVLALGVLVLIYPHNPPAVGVLLVLLGAGLLGGLLGAVAGR